jgi:hypothetical protein
LCDFSFSFNLFSCLGLPVVFLLQSPSSSHPHPVLAPESGLSVQKSDRWPSHLHRLWYID